MRRMMYADESHAPGLTKLWMEAFGDEKEYIHSFLTFQIRDRFSYVVCDDGEKDSVVSMAHAFPCKIKTPLADYEFVYLYAVATLKSYQGLGIASQMLEEIHRDLESRGFFGTFLFPADEDLFRYYEKLGYRLRGYSQKVDFGYEEYLDGGCFKTHRQLEDVLHLKCEEIKGCELLHYAKRLNEIKDFHYRDYPYEYWDEKHSKFMIYDGAYEKKRIMFFRYDKKECFLIWKMKEDDIIISEIAITEEGFQSGCREIIKSIVNFCRLDVEKGQKSFDFSKVVFKFTLPYWFEEGEEIPKAMIRFFGKKVDLAKFMPNNGI